MATWENQQLCIAGMDCFSPAQISIDRNTMGGSGGEPRKSVTLEHLAEVFGADGQNVLKRKAAVERLEYVAGIGRTAAYDALKADGPFGAYLDDTGEGLRFKAPSDA